MVLHLCIARLNAWKVMTEVIDQVKHRVITIDFHAVRLVVST